MTRSRALLILGLLFSALFLWLALRSIDIRLLGDALGRARLAWSWPFLGALIAFCWMKAARWAVLLEPVAPTTALHMLPSVVIGYAATTLMPMQLGEVARAYVAARTLGIRLLSALTTIALERILDVFALLVMLGIVLLLGTDVGQGLRHAGLWMLLAGLGAFGLLCAYTFHPELFNGWIRPATRWLPGKIQEGLAGQLSAIAQGVGILKRPARYLSVVLASALQWFFMLCCAAVSLRALGLDLPPTAPLLVLATTALGMALPSGPGYVGTIQLAFWLALAPFGVSREDAVAASIFYHSLLCGPLLLWGVFYLIKMRIGLRDLRQQSATVSTPAPPP